MSFYAANSTKKQLLKILKRVKEGETVEIMSHAGYDDPSIKQSFIQGLTHPRREQELSVLKHPNIKNAIEAYEIELIPFRKL